MYIDKYIYVCIQKCIYTCICGQATRAIAREMGLWSGNYRITPSLRGAGGVSPPPLSWYNCNPN